MKRNVIVEPDLTAVSFALSQTSRCAILQALMGGVALPASELAYQAGISNSSTSAHLKLLLEMGLIRAIQTGRHRYYELTSHVVAEIVEAMSVLAPKKARLRKQNACKGNLRCARLCYDHLAGRLGVSITNSMCSSGFIVRTEEEFELSQEGSRFLSDLGVSLLKPKQSRRSFAKPCIDWSERQAHVAGFLGASLATRLLELGWVIRSIEDRSLVVPDEGMKELTRVFKLSDDIVESLSL